MSKPNYKPGPWQKVRHPKTPDTVRIGPGIAITDEQHASIVAAAPEMLEALKLARTVLFNESAAENQPQLVRAWQQVCAAIEKAEDYNEHYCECGQRLEDAYGSPGDGFCTMCR